MLRKCKLFALFIEQWDFGNAYNLGPRSWTEKPVHELPFCGHQEQMFYLKPFVSGLRLPGSSWSPPWKSCHQALLRGVGALWDPVCLSPLSLWASSPAGLTGLACLTWVGGLWLSCLLQREPPTQRTHRGSLELLVWG